jgi:hypothetical protein
LILGEVTILRNVNVIYDKSPKLRIRGSGFEAEDHDIQIEIGAVGSKYLKQDKDFMLSKDPDGDGIILKLMGNRKWADLSERTPPVAMFINSVTFTSDPSKNLLPEPVMVAQILDTPTVEENAEYVLYQTASNELRINGTGFIGAKKIDLYFKPPLVKEIAYEDKTKYPIARDEIVLRIRHGYMWRNDVGPLTLIGIDTGGGPLKLGEDGIVVADVHADLDEHKVTVLPTASEQKIYADDPNLLISGTGFNPSGNVLRFSNGLVGNNVNFTTVKTTDESIALRLVPGSYWRRNFENLPGALTLLAVNSGEGFIAVGPTNSGKGRDVAMVFERPDVYSGVKKIFRTHSHELHIKGEGFPTSVTKPQLKFNPPLIQDTDYSVRVIDRTELELTLLDGRAWRTDGPGALQVVGINTRGDEAGWVTFGGDGIHVADVQEDLDAQATGGIEVFPMSVKVYQSLLRKSIDITGTGFKDGMSFAFDPVMKVGIDYDMSVESKNRVVLSLKAGKKWRSEAGFIIAKSITIDKKVYPLAGTDGIRVAVVLADPVITPGKESFHESQSKLIVLSGSGFTNVADTKINLRPTNPGSFKILGVLEDAIRLQLKPDQDWLPSFSSLKDEDENKKIPLVVTSIDCGAGDVVFEEPITVGYVVKDREGVHCDDSCEFAFDGVCDDGSEPNDQYYYQNYNKYQDDDLGGFYGENGGEDGEEGEGSGDGNAYAGQQYDDYYMENEDYAVSACVPGTDCTDCGGVDAVVDLTHAPAPDSGIESCTNTCIYPRDGVCDDPRGTKYCELGTDCQDCGPVGSDNFTRSDDDGWWDDDDDYWNFNDGNFNEQILGRDKNDHLVIRHKRTNNEPSGTSIFLLILEAMVYTVGAIFAAVALYLLSRWYKGQSIPCMNVFNPDLNMDINHRDFELANTPSRRMPITPDVIRT